MKETNCNKQDNERVTNREKESAISFIVVQQSTHVWVPYTPNRVKIALIPRLQGSSL